MKKNLLLIPSVIALSATPFICLSGCKVGGEDKPDPTPPEPMIIEVNEYHPREYYPELGYLQSPIISAQNGDTINFHIDFSKWVSKNIPYFIVINYANPEISYDLENKDYEVDMFKIKEVKLGKNIDFEYNARINRVEVIYFDSEEFSVEDDWTFNITVKQNFENCYLWIYSGT